MLLDRFRFPAGVGRAKEKIDEKQLRSRLARMRAEMPPPPESRPGGPQRLLFEEDYFWLMLFGMLNPVLDSMRGAGGGRKKPFQSRVCAIKSFRKLLPKNHPTTSIELFIASRLE